MEQWPSELLLNIFEYMEVGDLLASSLVCRRWKHLVDDCLSLWKRTLARMERRQSGRINFEISQYRARNSPLALPFLRRFTVGLHHKIATSSSERNLASRRRSRNAKKNLGSAKCEGFAVDFTLQICALKLAETTTDALFAFPTTSIVVCRLGDLVEMTRISCDPRTRLVGIVDGLLLTRVDGASIFVLDWRSIKTAEGNAAAAVVESIEVGRYESVKCCGAHLLVVCNRNLKVYRLRRNGESGRPVSLSLILSEPDVDGFWAMNENVEETKLYALATCDGRREGSKLVSISLTNDRPSRNEVVDIKEWLEIIRPDDDDDDEVEIAIEQRFLALKRNKVRRRRLVVDLGQSLTLPKRVLELPNRLRPLKNQSRRWAFFFDIRASSLEVRNAADGTVLISVDDRDDVIDLELDGSYFDADDFSIVTTSLAGNSDVVEFQDFF